MTGETESIAAASSLTRGTGSSCGEGWRGALAVAPRAERAARDARSRSESSDADAPRDRDAVRASIYLKDGDQAVAL